MLNLLAVPTLLLLPAPQEASPQEPSAARMELDNMAYLTIKQSMQECLNVRRPLEFCFRGGRLLCIIAQVVEVPRKEAGGYRTPAQKRPGSLKLRPVYNGKGQITDWEAFRSPGRRVPRTITLLPLFNEDGEIVRLQLVKGYAHELRKPRPYSPSPTDEAEMWCLEEPADQATHPGTYPNAVNYQSEPLDCSGQWNWPPELLEQLQ